MEKPLLWYVLCSVHFHIPRLHIHALDIARINNLKTRIKCGITFFVVISYDCVERYWTGFGLFMGLSITKNNISLILFMRRALQVYKSEWPALSLVINTWMWNLTPPSLNLCLCDGCRQWISHGGGSMRARSCWYAKVAGWKGHMLQEEMLRHVFFLSWSKMRHLLWHIIA